MHVAHTAAELAELAPAAGKKHKTRAIVMTMGALHEGHLALVRAAREAADQVIVTVFVNPLQFDDPIDLERYPRDIDADCALLEPLGVDIVFAPQVEYMYPGGDPLVTVCAGSINHVFEGAHRPGHFDGMLTVVLKLLNLTRPDLAFFGQKDAQQVIAIRAMCRDFILPVEIVVVPTVRDADGLALSSRNAFLTESERADALALSRALGEAGQVLDEGGPITLALAVGRAVLEEVPGVTPDYFAGLDPETSQPVPDDYRGEVIVAVAARVGATRLIDNIPAHVGPRAVTTETTAKRGDA
jgi:pantoate--beta-alanine ligase